MKMYEKLGIDPTTEEGALKIATILCGDIPDNYDNSNESCSPNNCIKCKIRRLFAEVPTKKIKRWEKYTNFIEAVKDFANDCGDWVCFGCKYAREPDISYCFANWLMEEIEVKDNGN